MSTDQQYTAALRTCRLQVLQPVDVAGNLRHAPVAAHPSKRKLHQHQADVAQVGVDQRGSSLAVWFGKTQRDVGLRDVPSS